MWLNYTFFLLLAVAILLAWSVRYKQLGLYIFSVAIAVGIAQNYITLQGLLVIVILGGTHYLLQLRPLSTFYQTILHTILIAFFVGFSYHLFPGFHNWKLVNQAYLSPTSLPYTMCLNVEQPVYGFFLLFFHAKEKITNKPWLSILRYSFMAFLLTLILLLIANYIYPIVAWDPKTIPLHFAMVWMIHMLLSTCLAEEAFFRGYIQAGLTQLLSKYSYCEHRIRKQ